MKGLKSFFGYVAIGVITLGVLLFLGSHSLNFFQFTFTDDDAIYAWLGLLLTSGGVIGWLVVFETLAKSVIQKGIALIMMVIGLLGEMATAVFDMRYSATYGSFNFTDAELGQMTLIIGLLGAITGFCLIAFFAGDHIVKAFQDDDKDGIPNWRDKQDNRRQVFAQNTPAVATQKPVNAPNQQGTNYQVRDLNKGRQAILNEFPDYQSFAAWCSTQFDHISGGNMKRLWAELQQGKEQYINPTKGGSRS